MCSQFGLKPVATGRTDNSLEFLHQRTVSTVSFKSTQDINSLVIMASIPVQV